MNVNKLFLAAGVAALMGAAAPAEATWCWGKKCGGSSGSSGGGSSSGGSSSGGTPTPVPEPEQMALFGLGAAVLGARVFVGRRRKK
ncbi:MULTISPECIES: PEP-CTERM sorting domain-containing protein [Sphingobium]|uniref:Cell wall anchor protein n=1 Tax=Sphingobium chungbukense TaxID=56193 RepID=A0A0M3ARI3_9SPHN|nr:MULTISPECIES: PEP-CTERM sorting domain-containing protein [Sphingobium]KKW92455.1 cell wall anchor protein [Sphingobium chungbukense]PJG49846.1 PEP-CTERM sorting domain-containing protein [Sphingobium sp. LB126]